MATYRRNTIQTFSVYSSMDNPDYQKHYEFVSKLTYQELLKYFIKRAEDRIIEWKQQLAEYHKEKWTDEGYKDILRDGKNRDETWLKDIREELTNFNQGLNPPSFYTKYQ